MLQARQPHQACQARIYATTATSVALLDQDLSLSVVEVKAVVVMFKETTWVAPAACSLYL